MYEIVTNLILLVECLIILGLLVHRRLESQEMDYSVTKILNGYIFEFIVGIYSGKIKIIKRPGCVLPWFIRHVDGWEIVFPMNYNDDQVNEFILNNNPPESKNTSHSKDLDVYRQVVIRRNEQLQCVAGKLCNLQ